MPELQEEEKSKELEEAEEEKKLNELKNRVQQKVNDVLEKDFYRNETKFAEKFGIETRRGSLKHITTSKTFSELFCIKLENKLDFFKKRKKEAQENGVEISQCNELTILQKEIPIQYLAYKNAFKRGKDCFKEKDESKYDVELDGILAEGYNFFLGVKTGQAYFFQFVMWIIHWLVQGKTNLNKNQRQEQISFLIEEAEKLIDNIDYWDKTRPIGNRENKNHDKQFEFLFLVNVSSYYYAYFLSGADSSLDQFLNYAERAKYLIKKAIGIKKKFGKEFGDWKHPDAHRGAFTIADIMKDYAFARELVDDVKTNRELLTSGIKKDIDDKNEFLNLKEQQIFNTLEK